MDPDILKKGCAGGKPRTLTFWRRQSRIDFPEKACLLRRRGGREPLEPVTQPHVGKKTIAVFVEMKEGPSAAIERAARFFTHAAALAQPFEQRLETIARFVASMLHASI